MWKSKLNKITSRKKIKKTAGYLKPKGNNKEIVPKVAKHTLCGSLGAEGNGIYYVNRKFRMGFPYYVAMKMEGKTRKGENVRLCS